MQESRQLILLPAGPRPFEIGLKGIMFYDPDTTNWHCLTFSFTLELPSFPCVDFWSPYQHSSAIQVSLSYTFGQYILWATGDQTGAALASSATHCEVWMLGFWRTKSPQLTATVLKKDRKQKIKTCKTLKRTPIFREQYEMCANVSGAEINACIFGRWANLHNSIHHLKMEIQISEDVVWLPMSRGNKKVPQKRKRKKRHR